MSNFTKADFNTIMNYLEHLEEVYYKMRVHVDAKARSSFNYDEKIKSVYLVKDRVESDFHTGLFEDKLEDDNEKSVDNA